MGIHRNELENFLEIMEKHVITEQENWIKNEWLDFAFGRGKSEIFSPKRQEPSATYESIPKILINDAIKDYDLMALREFGNCFRVMDSSSGSMMSVRSNYGTSIIMSLFGVEMAYMRDEQDTLPTSWPFKNWRDKVISCLNEGVPNLNTGLCAKVFEMGEYYLELLERYPNIKSCVHVCHPDFQGPLDICEVLIGSEVFYAFYDDSQLIKDFLSLITDTYIALMKKWLKLFPYNGEYSVHWGFLHRGCVMLRDDSAMNISLEMFKEFNLPYDSKIFKEFGGGAVHFCGKGDHYIKCMSEDYPMLYDINTSQPHLNNVEAILKNTVDKGINLLGFNKTIAAEKLDSGRSFSNRLHTG